MDNEVKRLAIHAVLASITKNCYYNPTENVKMVYPAIVYGEVESDDFYADNVKYLTVKYYTVQIIAQSPIEADSLLQNLLEHNYTERRSSFIQENLHHRNAVIKII